MSHLDTPAAQSHTVRGVSDGIRRLLSSQSDGLQVSHLMLRAVFGAVSGTALFLGVSHRLPLTSDLWLSTGVLFVAGCVLATTWSSFCRCSVLLVFPSMLSSRGQAYLMLFVLSVLCGGVVLSLFDDITGPVANIQRNVELAARSLSCNLDLQVNHSRLLWREAIRPVLLITQALMGDEAELQSQAQNISREFQTLRNDVIAQYGYEHFRSRRAAAAGAAASSTQELFTSRTRMQCDNVVDEGVQRCTDWFSRRWEECMKAIPVPVINHILCVPMQFHFLCDVMRVMTPWCREQIPVEGNFGQLFDQLNASIDQLSGEFSAGVIVQEQQQQEVLDKDFTEEVGASLRELMGVVDQLLDVLQLLLSFTFVAIFAQALGYLRRYQTDLHFDNVYVTAYFRQLDACRRRAGRRFLLPLTASEKKKLIEPCSLKIWPEELHLVSSGVSQVLSVSLLTVVLLTVDLSLYHVLDVVSRHSVSHINLTSHHQVDIRVGGDSIMARLLRRTVSAFNSSSDLNITVDNRVCVSPPSSLSAAAYGGCVGCILLVALFSCLQVYTNRLRRFIAAFFYPQTEKRRVLFLYNLQLQRRFSSTDSEHSRRRDHSSRAVWASAVSASTGSVRHRGEAEQSGSERNRKLSVGRPGLPAVSVLQEQTAERDRFLNT